MPTQTRNLTRLLKIMARLRGPRGCPWDREQTHASLRHHLLEECYEALDALAAGRPGEFQEELGDLLLQIVFHAQLASEAGQFNFDGVAKTIADKLVRRHPHVFGKGRLQTSGEVLRQWEEIKQTEKKTGGRAARRAAPSVVAELPRSLPALLKADKVQRQVSRVGFDWKHVNDVVAKVEEELAEMKHALAAGPRRQFEEELGDLLFAVVNLARFEGLHAEDLLHRTIAKFVRRFQQVERAVHRQGRRLEDCTLGELDALWDKAKRRRRHRST